MSKRQSDEMSRAEKIRAQKEHSHRETPSSSFGNSATRKQTKHHVPVTRRSTPRVPMVNRKRHKVHVPLKNKGAELQLPALPRLELGWRIISGMIFIFSLAVVISISSFNAFEVSGINLIGAQRLGAEAILSQLDVVGTSIINVQPDVIETKLTKSFPSLRSVSVSVGLPASVTIQVDERQPFVLWNQNNASLWIDAEGVMFPIRGEADVSLTVIANSDPPAPPPTFEVETETPADTEAFFLLEESTLPHTTTEFVQGILSLSEYIPEGSQLQYDPEFGLGWQDPHGWLVYFGRDTNNIEIKLAEYQTIITALQNANITPSLISLEFLHAPFYRLEQ